MAPSVRAFQSILRFDRARDRAVRRAALAMVLACWTTLALTLGIASRRFARTSERLASAAKRLDALATASPDNQLRAAIVWGYAERLRLGLESPFRLVETAAGDPRLTGDERRTVAWALLGRIMRGESAEVDPAVFDGIGPTESDRTVSGEQHLHLIRGAITGARNPRAAELAVRFTYTLAASERLVDGASPVLAAEAAALIADRRIARIEAVALVRAIGSGDPVDMIGRRRARRSFYVERPALLWPDEDVERQAIAMVPSLLDSLRALRPDVAAADGHADVAADAYALAPRLYAAGARVPPAAPLAVTVQRYLPIVRAEEPRIDADALARTRNGEMLVAVTRLAGETRAARRAVGRMMLAAGVAMRSMAQERVWFAGDSSRSIPEVAAAIGVAAITFDRDVPTSWHAYYLRSLEDGVRDLRRVLPALNLSGVHVRFRTTSPSDSALAMHDPRTRTLQLPIYTAGGTLSHELAHDLDRQSALALGASGYRSDLVARGDGAGKGRRLSTTDGKLAASLRALTEEMAETPAAAAPGDRPAEIFATRVDWFVASALARRGLSNAFLSAVQDELLTGHVVHPERLRTSGRSRTLLDALDAMTTVAPFARDESPPGVQAVLRWSLSGPVDRRVAFEILRGGIEVPELVTTRDDCGRDMESRAQLVRLAAESRARGWLRLRARWTPEPTRAPWARAALGQAPWSAADAERRVALLRDYILAELGSTGDLPVGLPGYAGPLALEARCER